MELAVIGSGYVGLVAGACLSDAGNQVVCVDVSQAKPSVVKSILSYTLKSGAV